MSNMNTTAGLLANGNHMSPSGARHNSTVIPPLAALRGPPISHDVRKSRSDCKSARQPCWQGFVRGHRR